MKLVTLHSDHGMGPVLARSNHMVRSDEELEASNLENREQFQVIGKLTHSQPLVHESHVRGARGRFQQPPFQAVPRCWWHTLAISYRVPSLHHEVRPPKPQGQSSRSLKSSSYRERISLLGTCTRLRAVATSEGQISPLLHSFLHSFSSFVSLLSCWPIGVSSF